MKLDKGELTGIENIISERMKEIVKEQDKFILEKFDTMDCVYVGYKIKNSIPKIVDAGRWQEQTVKSEIYYDFVGFDEESELNYYLEKGYGICKKTDLEKVRCLI